MKLGKEEGAVARRVFALSQLSFEPNTACASGCLRGHFVTKEVIKHISPGMSATRYVHLARENASIERLPLSAKAPPTGKPQLKQE